MKIAILGAGNIGGTLGQKWAAAGREVVFGVRDPNSAKAQGLRASYPPAALKSVAEAVAFGDVALFSTPHAAVAEIVQAHAAALTGKIIIDATNNFGAAVVNHVQTILDAAPSALVFRAFNSLGWEHFANPRLDGAQIDHFYCGPDGQARAAVEQLIAAIGVRPVWVGGHEMLSVVDALGALWVTLAFRRGWGRGIALKLLGK